LFCAIIFGTMFAFWFFIASLQYLYPQESSLLGTIEPLTALVVSVIWLGDSFGPWQLLGVGMIIFMVVFLSIFKSK
ncbi:EamA family transporter, partial [Staphylococcus epidermidis]